jgi:hypothetical protein
LIANKHAISRGDNSPIVLSKAHAIRATFRSPLFLALSHERGKETLVFCPRGQAFLKNIDISPKGPTFHEGAKEFWVSPQSGNAKEKSGVRAHP